MYYPKIDGAASQKVSLDTFGGLNRSYACGDSEFADMMNMTGDDFPCVSVRGQRQEMQGTSNGEKLDFLLADNENATQYNGDTGIKLTEDSFRYFYRGEEKEVYRSVQIYGLYNNSSKKYDQFLNYPIGNNIDGISTFGLNVIAYPYPEILNKGKLDPNENENYIYTGDYSEEDGWKYNSSLSRENLVWGIDFIKSKTNHIYIHIRHRNISPVSAKYGYTEDNVYAIQILAGANSEYNTSPYYGMQSKLKPGMRIRLEEFETVDGKMVFTGEDFGVAFFAVLATEVGVNGNEILVSAYTKEGTPFVQYDLDYAVTNEEVTVGKGLLVTVLKADVTNFVSYQNRLWGTDTLGTSLYCSSATDIYDWEIDATDAHGGYVDVPENSPWTALYSYNGYLYAFKANKMYKIMGSTALDYAAISLCEIGCTNQEAVCVSESVMYFLSEDGVYAFTGNLPVKVSGPLAESYVRGHLAGDSGKVYASLTKKDGTTEFLVYDTEKRLWHKEDDLVVRSYVNYAGELYALAEDKTTYKLTGGSPSGVPFSLTTKKYFYLFDKKAVSYVNLYTETEGEDAKLDVFVSYDGKEFEPVAENVQDRRVKIVPVRLKKCDTFQFKLSGVGGVRLRQIEFVLHTGGVPYR